MAKIIQEELINQSFTNLNSDTYKVIEYIKKEEYKMKTKIINKANGSFDISIGRDSEWGNPYPMKIKTIEEKSENVFLGRDYAKSRDFSDQVALEIDEQVRKIIEDCYEKAKKIMDEHMEDLFHEDFLYIKIT